MACSQLASPPACAFDSSLLTADPGSVRDHLPSDPSGPQRCLGRRELTRAVGQAAQIREETIQLLKLPPEQQARLTAIARP